MGHTDTNFDEHTSNNEGEVVVEDSTTEKPKKLF